MRRRTIIYDMIVIFLLLLFIGGGFYINIYGGDINQILSYVGLQNIAFLNLSLIENVQRRNNENLDYISTNTRKTQLCIDTSPENAKAQIVTFTQNEKNGTWVPQNKACDWSCKKGFEKDGNSCIDINECEIDEEICGNSGSCENIVGGYVCNKQSFVPKNDGYNRNHHEIYEQIYLSYPAYPNGKEVMYPFLEEGSVEVGMMMLNDTYEVSNRYEPVKLENLSWTENPYDERYWRFIFYSLRPTRNLLYSYEVTKDEKYLDKTASMMLSFSNNFNNSPYTWDDPHAVAYRAMVLTNTWWKLREENKLDEELGVKMLSLIEDHGEYLEKEENYEPDNNHAITQAAALFLIGVNFPDLPKAKQWEELGRQRLDDGITTIVADDGAIYENSPYYHFYTLRLYYNIYRYSLSNGIEITPKFENQINDMVKYSTYILQPDRRVPLYGASIDSEVRYSEEYKMIAQDDPHFLYVLTDGKNGTVPSQRSIFFEDSGQTILRSGWGEKDIAYENETYVLFDTGDYRTDHSDLDALSFHLYAKGNDLITDTGLYTYEEETRYRDYFHGTRGHNTVEVDEKDQQKGKSFSGRFVEGDDFSYHSGYHNLYENITHSRGLLLFKDDVLIVVDKLDSSDRNKHLYSQLYHFS